MTAPLHQRFRSAIKKPKRLALAFLIPALLFGLFGYFILPSIIRSKAEKVLTETLHRPVTIEKVSVSPYWLAVTLHDFKIAEPDGKQTFMSVEALRVRVSPLSLLRMAPVIGNITLSKPYVHLSRNSAGQFNIQDLLAPQPEKPASKADKNVSPTATKHTIGSINIEEGHFVYENTAQGKAFRAAVEQFDLDIDSLKIDLEKRRISFDEIESANAVYKFTYLKTLKDFPAFKPVPPSAAATPKPAKKPYVVHIEDINIENWTAKFEDQRLTQSAETTVSGIALNARQITTELGKSNSLDVNASINGKGTLGIKGEYSISPLAANLNLTLKDASIAGFRPLFANNLNLIITSARLSANGALKIKEDANGDISGVFNADASLDDVNCIDGIHQHPLLGWKSLAIKDIHAEFMPLAITMDSVTLEDYFANLLIDEAGRLNLKNVIRQNKTPPQATDKRSQNPPLPFKINTVTLKQGQIRFTDDYIKPNYRGEISRLNATIKDISSEKNHKASLNLQARVNRSPFSLKGSLHPFDDNLFLNLQAELKGLELLPLTAYAGQYAGYGIEEGTLSLKSQYNIAHQKLTANNRLILNQIKLSAQPTNPETALPLPLAVALLRDIHGNIDINLPMSGDLSDPDFSVGGIVVQVLVNTIMKAVTSPFALLGSAFGDSGEELGWLAFSPGQFTLDKANQKKLDMLAEALLSRPALKLEIVGMADPEADDEGLRRENIRRRVRQQKLEKLGVDEDAEAAKKIEVTSNEYPELLKDVYLDEIGFSFNRLMGKEKDKTVPEMEKFLMAKVKVEKNDIPALAAQRAAVTKAWLITHGKIPAERIEMAPPKLITISTDPAKGAHPTSRVDFNIKR